MRLGLCTLILVEITVLGIREQETLGRLWGETFHMDRQMETLREADSPDAEGHISTDKTNRGITIDLKKGRIEFWKTDEAVRPENGG